MATRFQFPDEDWGHGTEDAALDISLRFAGTFSGTTVDARGLVGPVGVVRVGYFVVDPMRASATTPQPPASTGGKTYVY